MELIVGNVIISEINLGCGSGGGCRSQSATSSLHENIQTDGRISHLLIGSDTVKWLLPLAELGFF